VDLTTQSLTDLFILVSFMRGVLLVALRWCGLSHLPRLRPFASRYGSAVCPFAYFSFSSYLCIVFQPVMLPICVVLPCDRYFAWCSTMALLCLGLQHWLWCDALADRCSQYAPAEVAPPCLHSVTPRGGVQYSGVTVCKSMIAPLSCWLPHLAQIHELRHPSRVPCQSHTSIPHLWLYACLCVPRFACAAFHIQIYSPLPYKLWFPFTISQSFNISQCFKLRACFVCFVCY
jgi:hypothetical protein